MKSLVLVCSLLLSIALTQYVAPLYAEWAHHHVVWLNGRQQNQQKFLKLIDDYEKHNIKVGGALIDSAWSTGFNNFQWDRKKFPHPEEIIKKMHAKGIRVLLWVTSMINEDSSIFQEAKKNGYLLNNGKTAKWWHGKGGFLDYFNPKAVQWWHKLMDKVINIGVDGFKCDGTDPITFLIRPWPYSSSAKRYIIGHQYGHKYYGDFYNYTKSKNPDALIMARPTDSFQTFISWNFSPQYVMFSGWVGDQDSSADGLRSAMYNVVKSAWHGYLNFGFDIGGYRGQNITKNIFLRWVQVGALLPFMENGGNGKHQPWVFDNETVDIYRYYVDLHYKLKPTFLTCAAQKYPHKKSVITPIAEKVSKYSQKAPQNYVYLLCDNMLVAPIFQQTGQAQVIFPKGSNWVYYFDNKKIFKGGSRNFYTFNIHETPLFLKTNSIIALQDELLVVSLKDKTKIQKTIIYGSYSDNLQLQYREQQLKIRVNRYFKDQVSSNETLKTLSIRLVGFKNTNGNFIHQISTAGTDHIIPNLKIDQNQQLLDKEEFIQIQ